MTVIQEIRKLIDKRKKFFLQKIKTKKDLVKFFEKIPANKWCTNMMYNDDNSKSCALGHLGFGDWKKDGDNKVAKHLGKILNDSYGTHTLLLSANDRVKTNPKRRVINFIKTYKGDLSDNN
jgi:hypothetical protein